VYHRFHREQKGSEVIYDVMPQSVDIQTDVMRMKIDRRDQLESLAIEIHFLADNILRMKIKPTDIGRQRYEIVIGDVLVSEPKADR